MRLKHAHVISSAYITIIAISAGAHFHLRPLRSRSYPCKAGSQISDHRGDHARRMKLAMAS